MQSERPEKCKDSVMRHKGRSTKGCSGRPLGEKEKRGERSWQPGRQEQLWRIAGVSFQRASGGPFQLLNPTPAVAGVQSRAMCSRKVGEQTITVPTPALRMLLRAL